MLHHKILATEFCVEELQVAVYVRNWVASMGKDHTKNPYELLFRRKRNLSYLGVFGRQCWYTNRPTNQSQLDYSATEVLFIRYKKVLNGYELCLSPFKAVIDSRDVYFDEAGAYYQKASSNNDENTMQENAKVGGLFNKNYESEDNEPSKSDQNPAENDSHRSRTENLNPLAE